MRWLTFMCGPLLVAAIPKFDPTALLKEVLIPADAAVGSIIYRLRATDPTFDFPLEFSIQNRSTIVDIESLNCTRFNSVCQANVILQRRLEIGRYYDFTVVAQNKRGESTNLNCSFRATNATTPIEKIFPGAPTLIMVSEKSRRNTELGTIIAKGNPKRSKAVLLELWGSSQFGLHQRLITDRDAEGTILLLSPLDYETRTVHHLSVLANDPWTEMTEDTRNIASWPLLIAVMDEQDTPPVFTIAPPTTILSPSLQPGDVILRVHAEDGDRGKPRDIRYGLLPDGNPFVSFFDMSEDTGELRLAKPLRDILSISHSGQPILLTVVAEEVRANPQESPAQSSTVRLALIPPGVTAGSPTFGSLEYNALLDENSPTGTVLELAQAEINTQPGDVVTLEMQNNNNTFDISPGVVEGHATFHISVHDPKLLDYEERHSVQCFIVAKEIGTGNFTAKVKLTVLLNDINDNPPEFTKKLYEAHIQEHSEIGTTVLRVEAHDADSDPDTKIRYSGLSGAQSQLFAIDELTGVVTVANKDDLDAELYPKGITITVEAKDNEGNGLSSTATILITLNDINDNAPDCPIFEFIINPTKNGFTTNATVVATDKDLTPPNNKVLYEIFDYRDKLDNLEINKETGKLYLTSPWTRNEVYDTRVRAWDGGIPRHWVECEVRIYPPEGQTRRMEFIVPGGDPDREKIAETLRALTGGKVTIDEVRPYVKDKFNGKDDDTEGERSVIVATVRYSKNAVIDVDRIQQILDSDQRANTNRNKQKVIQQSNSSDLLWVLILLIVLALIIAIILILCCICSPCPLYIPPKKRQIRSAEMVEKLVVKGSAQGHESKSVQVAEWFGRREAWTPEPIMDGESESLRRHEFERGSERGGVKRTVHRQQHIHREPSRDQLYIREGNADILRLITRAGTDPQRPDQPYMADSGKDILMRRYIDQQQSQTLLPNTVNRLQTENELLEASLRQQNAMLRQMLLERERDFRLETQSLPAGTQTDQDAGTQTEPLFLRPPRREIRSDNDASDASDDEMAIIKERIKRRNGRRMDRAQVKRKIKTPIQEESEVEVYEPKPQKSIEKSSRPKIKQTKTSEMRQRRSSSEQSRPSKSAIRKEVLREISMSLDQSDKSDKKEILREISSSIKSQSDKSMEEQILRKEILRKISASLEHLDEPHESSVKNEILRKISASLEPSDSTLSESTIRNEILNEIIATVDQSDMNISESDLKNEILRKISSSFEKSEKSNNSESEALRREILRKISASLDQTSNKSMDEAVTRNEILRKISSSLDQTDRSVGGSPMRTEILRKISASLEQSNMSDAAMRNKILRKISNSLEKSGVDDPEVKKEVIRQVTITLDQSDSGVTEVELRDEILRRVFVALDRTEKSLGESLKDEILRKVSASLERREDIERRNDIIRKISSSLENSDKSVDDPKLQKEILRQITVTLEHNDKILSESELRDEILRRVSVALDQHEQSMIEAELKNEILRKISTSLESSSKSRTNSMVSRKQSTSRERSQSAIRADVLKEIATSLDHSDKSASEEELRGVRESFSEDSLEDISPRSEKATDSSIEKPRYHSESDARRTSSQSGKKISFSDDNLRATSNIKSDPTSNKSKRKDSNRKKPTKRTSRYMEWYNKQKADGKDVKDRRKSIKNEEKDHVKETNAAKESLKTINGTKEGDSKKKSESKKISVGPDHPLLQHSEHRFEAQYPPPGRRPEEDTDSGIALTRPPKAQKKSVFTIAYDDMHTSQLRPDSTTPPL